MTASSIHDDMATIPEHRVTDAADLDALLRAATVPFVVRGLVVDWPIVAAACQSDHAARAYLLARHRDVPFTVSVGTSDADSRLFYDAAMQMNFKTFRATLPEIFAKIDLATSRPTAPPIYLASIDLQRFFDGVHEANHVDLGDRPAMASIWIGTRTRIAAHNDLPDNLACVAAGRRRFTLFPREQFPNLYLGPIDNTPAGRTISMVDFDQPDFERFPRFQEALRHAGYAVLDPGDAIFIPAGWWHHVEGLERFNILVNYWWRTTPTWLGQPQDALNHAIMAIRDLPQDQRMHWRDMFDHYVFSSDPRMSAHIPEDARGVLAPMTPDSAGRMRAFLLRQLSR